MLFLENFYIRAIGTRRSPNLRKPGNVYPNFCKSLSMYSSSLKIVYECRLKIVFYIRRNRSALWIDCLGWIKKYVKRHCIGLTRDLKGFSPCPVAHILVDAYTLMPRSLLNYEQNVPKFRMYSWCFPHIYLSV